MIPVTIFGMDTLNDSWEDDIFRLEALGPQLTAAAQATQAAARARIAALHAQIAHDIATEKENTTCVPSSR